MLCSLLICMAQLQQINAFLSIYGFVKFNHPQKIRSKTVTGETLRLQTFEYSCR